MPKSTPVVAVVDPARDGLHGTVVQTLRKNEKIDRLVYVSCNPTGTLVRDAAMLCAAPTKVSKKATLGAATSINIPKCVSSNLIVFTEVPWTTIQALARTTC